MNQFKERRLAWIFAGGGFLLSLLGSLPYYWEYLRIPNREFLLWDMALHAKDGVTLLIQLKRFDFVSLLWSFINMSFWMPLHPVLIALVSLVAPFRVEAYVFLNLLVLAVGTGWSFYLMARSGRFQFWQKTVFFAGMSFFLMRIGNSPHFWLTHYNVMIESLGLGLTLIFATAALLDGTEKDNVVYRRTAVVSLSLLFFTKIQYGMFFGAAYFLHYLWKDRVELFGLSGHFPRAWEALKRSRILLASCVLLFVAGVILLASREHLGDGIACVVFAFVLAISFLPGVRREAPPFLQDFYRYLLIPFGWFYFFPIKNKVRFLLYNAATSSGETTSEKFTALICDLGEHYLSLRLWTGFALLCIIFLMGLAILRFRPRTDRIRPGLGWLLIAFFYFPMSLASVARISRFSLTWVAVIAVVFFLEWISLIHRRTLLIVVTLLLLAGTVREFAVQPREEMRLFLSASGFLNPEEKSLSAVLERLDFNRPGVVYGLGSVMDQATILFDWKIIQAHPEYTSAFSRREDRDFVANDFGREGNRDPSAEILRRAQNSTLRQIVLFHVGFESKAWESLRASLIALGFKPVLDTSETLFLSR